jgi:plastocyanin
MKQIHPHWQQTEPDEVHPVDIATPRAQPSPTAIPAQAQWQGRKTVSRRPAAVVGILAAMATGFLFMQDFSPLSGDVGGGVEVRVTEQGLLPPVVTIPQGGSITWINQDTIPHILSAENLATQTSPSLETPVIFPDTRQTMQIAADAKPGTYLYISKTSEFITGQIIVEGGAQAASKARASAPASIAGASSEPATVIGGNAPEPAFEVASSAAASSERSVEAYEQEPQPSEPALPVNPHIVGSTPTTPLAGHVTQRPTSPTPRPQRNAETGPAVWVVMFGAVAGLWLATRRSFRRIPVAQPARD